MARLVVSRLAGLIVVLMTTIVLLMMVEAVCSESAKTLGVRSGAQRVRRASSLTQSTRQSVEKRYENMLYVN